MSAVETQGLTVQAVAADAAELIRHHGWWVGGDEQGCGYCIGLAVSHAASPRRGASTSAHVAVKHQTLVALALLLDIPVSDNLWDDIFAWNDTPGRTVEAVLAALDTVAA